MTYKFITHVCMCLYTYIIFVFYLHTLPFFFFIGDLEALKKKTFAVKEGIQYRIRIDFYVQREIVTGLKYIQKVMRHGIQRKLLSFY